MTPNNLLSNSKLIGFASI